MERLRWVVQVYQYTTTALQYVDGQGMIFYWIDVMDNSVDVDAVITDVR